MQSANDLGTVPIGGIVGWLKTYGQKATGTNTSTTASKLNDSGANFVSSGVKDWMIVRNTTDTTWSYVTTAGVAATQLSLKANIFTATPKTYHVFATPYLPDEFVECNGQSLSDTESILNGLTIPDLNASSGTKRFLRGSTVSGATADNETHSHTVNSHDHTLGSHTHTIPSHTHTVTPATLAVCRPDAGTAQNYGNNTQVTTSGPSPALTADAASGNTGTASPGTNTGSSLPSYYEVVWVIRIK